MGSIQTRGVSHRLLGHTKRLSLGTNGLSEPLQPLIIQFSRNARHGLWSPFKDFSATAFTTRSEWFSIDDVSTAILRPHGESGPMADIDGDRVDADVAADHYLHWAAMLGAAAYAWHLYGIWLGIACLIGLMVAIMATNALITATWAKSPEEAGALPSRAWRRSRWGWVIFAFVVLGASAAQTCDTHGACSGIFW